MADVKQEVERLLAQMRERAATLQDVRDTVEIAAIVRQEAIPAILAYSDESLIPALARARLMGAWVQYAARRAPHAA